jgi:hypothetical protein
LHTLSYSKPKSQSNRKSRAILKKSEKRRTKTGFMAAVYQLIAGAYLVIVSDKINLDAYIEKAPEVTILSALGAF